MNIYLDIDGVLLASEIGPALFVNEFIELVMWNWPENTYWLTTHCWRGENRALSVLTPHLKPKAAQLIRQIKPTEWGSVKTDAIDFKTPFLWFDDDLYPEEKKILEHYKAVDCLRRVNLSTNPAQLMDEISYLKSLV